MKTSLIASQQRKPRALTRRPLLSHCGILGASDRKKLTSIHLSTSSTQYISFAVTMNDDLNDNDDVNNEDSDYEDFMDNSSGESTNTTNTNGRQ